MEPITTAIAAFGAVQQAVSLIKKAAATVDDVKSLGPLLGRYFDAKHNAVKAVKAAKKEGGSNMGRAIEIEMAIKQQADFEKELQFLFMQTGNVDVWNNIMRRVAEMNREDMLEERRQRDAALKRKKQLAEAIDLGIGLALAVIVLALFGWGVVALLAYCKVNSCG